MAGKGRVGPNRLYTIWRKTTRPDGLLSVPSDIVALVPVETAFTVELTDEGILYRVTDVPDTEPVQAPKWAKASSNHKPQKAASKTTRKRKRSTAKRKTAARRRKT